METSIIPFQTNSLRNRTIISATRAFQAHTFYIRWKVFEFLPLPIRGMCVLFNSLSHEKCAQSLSFSNFISLLLHAFCLSFSLSSSFFSPFAHLSLWNCYHSQMLHIEGAFKRMRYGLAWENSCQMLVKFIFSICNAKFCVFNKNCAE